MRHIFVGSRGISRGAVWQRIRPGLARAIRGKPASVLQVRRDLNRWRRNGGGFRFGKAGPVLRPVLAHLLRRHGLKALSRRTPRWGLPQSWPQNRTSGSCSVFRLHPRRSVRAGGRGEPAGVGRTSPTAQGREVIAPACNTNVACPGGGCRRSMAVATTHVAAI